MKFRDTAPHPAIARVQQQADLLAAKHRGFAFERVVMTLARQAALQGRQSPMQPPEIPSPTRFFRRMAGLRGADVRA